MTNNTMNEEQCPMQPKIIIDALFDRFQSYVEVFIRRSAGISIGLIRHANIIHDVSGEIRVYGSNH